MSKMPSVSVQEVRANLINAGVNDNLSRFCDIVGNIVTFRGSSDKSMGVIRATKPKDGVSAYVWRMVVFQVSPNSVHHCMPVTADFDLPAYDQNNRWSSKLAREMGKELDVVVDAIVKSIPKNEWHGINRWARAMF